MLSRWVPRLASSACLCLFLAAAGCGFLPQWPDVPSVGDVSPDDPNSGQDPPDIRTGRVVVEVVNPTELDAAFTLEMFVLDRQVHLAERRIPAGNTIIEVGPDQADRIEIVADFVAIADDAPQTGTFRLGQQFDSGDRVQFVLVAPEPNEPNEPNDGSGNPGPLLVSATLTADLLLEIGETALINVEVVGTRPGVSLNVFADPGNTQANGDELTILQGQAAAAANANEVEWNTAGVAAGLYRIYAEAVDLPRLARSAYAGQTVRVIEIASVAIGGLAADVEVDAGQAVPFAVLSERFLSGASVDVFADPDDVPASGNEILVAGDLAADAEAPLVWDTTGVAPGDYRIYAELDNLGRLKRSGPAAGRISVLSPLALSFAGLDADRSAAPGDTIEFSVASQNFRAGATLDVVARSLSTPSAAAIVIVEDAAAIGQLAVAWDTSGVAEGVYQIEAVLTDGARNLAATAVGRVALAIPLAIQLTLPAADVALEFGQTFDIAGTIAGSFGPEAAIDLYARPVVDGGDPNSDPNGDPNFPIPDPLPSEILLATLPAAPAFDTTITIGEQFAFTTYEIYAVLRDGSVALPSAPAAGRVTVLVPLFVFVTSPNEPVELERGQTLELEVSASGQGPGGSVALFAQPFDPNAVDPNAVPDPNADDLLTIVQDQPIGGFELLATWDTADVAFGHYRFFAVLSDGARRRVSAFSSGLANVVPALAIRITEPDAGSKFVRGADIPITVEIDRSDLGGEAFLFAVPEGQDPNSEANVFIAGFDPLPTQSFFWKTGQIEAIGWDLYAVFASNDGRDVRAGPLTVEIVPPPVCPGDADGDLDVDLDDLLVVLSNFGSTQPSPPGDLDGNGAVNLDDLLIVLSNFGDFCD